MTEQNTQEEYLTPAQVGRLFNVHAKTVARWAKDGKLSYIVTFGGHRRFPKSEVMAKFQEGEDG